MVHVVMYTVSLVYRSSNTGLALTSVRKVQGAMTSQEPMSPIFEWPIGMRL